MILYICKLANDFFKFHIGEEKSDITHLKARKWFVQLTHETKINDNTHLQIHKSFLYSHKWRKKIHNKKPQTTKETLKS